MRIRLQGSGHAAGLLSELNRCRQARLYCDVLLQAAGRSFPAHRAVLACAATHFRGMFAARGQTGGSGNGAYSLDFVSPANLDRVLTFIYTGEILTDLIDVGVLYELAVRLGVRELVRACHATFPDLPGSASSEGVAEQCAAGGGGGGELDVTVAAAAAASACSSSAASCSSLSSSAGPSATPTPAGPSPLPLQGRAFRRVTCGRASPPPLTLKAEDVHSHLGYGQMGGAAQGPGGDQAVSASSDSQTEGGAPGGLLSLKTELGEEGLVRGGRQDGEGRAGGGGAGPLTPCPFPDPAAPQAGAEAGTSPSSGDPLDGLRLGTVEGGVAVVEEEGEAEEEDEEEEEERDPLQGDGSDMAEQWRQLAGEIIELSDDDNYMEEEEEEEEEEDDLVCVENGGGEGSSRGSAAVAAATCKACGASVAADAASLRAHAEARHLAELTCRVCGAAFPERGAAVAHALSHVGVPLFFSCDMCRLQFGSRARLLRHRRQAAAGHAPHAVQGQGQGQGQGPELQCAVCTKALAKDFQAVRDHLLTHVCPQSLSCGVCQLPQPSLCALLWHALAHLSLPVFSCPLCACSFLERPLLDRHMAAHAEEEAAAGGRRELSGGPKPEGEEEELSCFLCPQTFRSSSAFHYHLSMHTSEPLGGGGQGWPSKRKADHPPDGPPPAACPLDGVAGSLGKLSGMGFGLGMGGFSLSDKLLQGAVPNFPAGLLTNGSSGLDVGGAGAGAPRAKWYRCRYCGKRFAHSGEFTYHLRIHTGEKPYQCKVCLRFFRGRSTMICHLKTHAGALMYRCTVCGLYFSTLKLVSSHMEVHKDHLPPDFNIEQTFMYNDHSKEPLPSLDT